MKSHKIKTLLLSAALALFNNTTQAAPTTKDSIDWPKFMAKQDMHFKTLPRSWKEAPHFGNAMIGSTLEQSGNTIRMRIYRGDVHEHRDETQGWQAYSRAHLLIGYFQLQPKGKLTGCNWRKNLWNAELTGTITTDKGEIKIHHFTHAQDMAIVTRLTPTEGEINCTWTWHPAEPRTTRSGYPTNKAGIKAFARQYGNFYADLLELYKPNPKGTLKTQDNITLWTQDLLPAGQYATAYTETKSKDGNTSTLIATIANSYPERTAAKTAVSDIKRVAAQDFKTWHKAHTDWWHTYYKKSYVNIPDKGLEALYWQNIYRMACCSRPGRNYIDTPGLWLQGGGWCYTTINWNIQAAHWPAYAANRLNQSSQFLDHFYKQREEMKNAVRPVEWQTDSYMLPHSISRDLRSNRFQYRTFNNQVGSLPWVTHNFWLQYRYSMDETLLREKIFPIMRKSANFYLHMLKKGPDGKLHLPPTHSPEAGDFKDANFDLALLKWQCHTLLKTCKILKIEDPLIPRWKEIIANTIDFPVDEKGYRMGSEKSVVDHRHLSHLMMIYPLHLVNIDQANEETNKAMNKSLEMANTIKGLPGMVQAHAAPMAAHLGQAETALKGLKRLQGDLHPNGFWFPTVPLIEVPMGIPNTIQEMLLQSWSDPTKDESGPIRTFPATPKEWKNATFHDLRTEGAFLVSAERKNGKTTWISIKSLAGAPCTIKPNMPNGIKIQTNHTLTKTKNKDTYTLNLKKGETAILIQK